MTATTSATTNRRVALVIVALVGAYLLSAAPGIGLPQAGRDAALHAEQHAAEAAGTAAASAAAHAIVQAPPLWTVLPFVGLLLAIAVLPLIHRTEHWWESNLHRFYVAAALAAITLVYYLFFHHGAVEGHWP
jgi:hypothetical protein